MNEEVKINCDNDVMKYSPDQIYDKFDDLQTREQKLQNNWNELKKCIKETIEEYEKNRCILSVFDKGAFATTKVIYHKMQELEQGKDE